MNPLLHDPLPAWLALLCCLATALVLEQLLTRGVQALLLRRQPMVPDREASAGYQRSLFTPGSRASLEVGLGILVSGLCAWLGWAGFTPAWALAALGLAAAAAWDLWTWECVQVSAWQVVWRRGRSRQVRRLALGEISRVHVVERGLDGRDPTEAGFMGRRLGTCYLALELHSGGAIKLPRTGWLAGAGQVRASASLIRRQRRQADRERMVAIRHQLNALSRRARPLPDAEQVALQHELCALKDRQALDDSVAAGRLFALVRAERQVRLPNPHYIDTIQTRPFEGREWRTVQR